MKFYSQSPVTLDFTSAKFHLGGIVKRIGYEVAPNCIGQYVSQMSHVHPFPMY
ncbi:unnamed protein product, partial [Larinioides sclopetarius]